MPISCESQYCLDSMAELGRITVNIHQFAYHTRLDIDGIIDDLEGRRHSESNLEQGVISSYDNWIKTAPKNDKLFTSLTGVLESELQIKEISNQIIDNIVCEYTSDIFESGVCISSEEDLVKPENVLYFLENNSQQWLELFKQQYRVFVDSSSNINISEFVEWDRERVLLMKEERERIQEQFRIDYESGNFDRNSTKRQTTNVKENKMNKMAKKVVRRGVEKFSQLFGSKDIKAFITGDDFVVEGELYNYRVSKTFGILEHSARPTTGHIPYKLQFLTKDNIVLAEGCVIFEDTPVIDQLIALMLHVKNNNEDEILRNTNFSNITEAYHSDALLQQIKEDKKAKFKENGGDLFLDLDSLFPELKEVEKYRSIIRPVIEDVFVSSLDIPERAMRFMLNPTIKYDEIHMVGDRAMEQALLEFHS